ncbi:hypothetical protein KUTeg_007073 [Tegillarca granosa]|uniref:Uncharacterized protein n=1 Tax=Tegillarca granosa TaxID=220873 RepID=A0ABQ9FGV4_TEGGR|nr:hypothetical protein KUTeg_007073 [Tegillarca granosa]
MFVFICVILYIDNVYCMLNVKGKHIQIISYHNVNKCIMNDVKREYSKTNKMFYFVCNLLSIKGPRWPSGLKRVHTDHSAFHRLGSNPLRTDPSVRKTVQFACRSWVVLSGHSSFLYHPRTDRLEKVK